MLNVLANILGVRQSSLVDADVSDFISRVSSNGGTVTQTEYSATNILVNYLKVNNLWDKFTDIALVIGGFAGSLVKLKYSDASVKSMVSDGTAFVSGDYDPVKGLTSLTTNKRLKIGCVPTSAGLSNTDFSVTCLFNRSLMSSASKVIVSDRQSPFVIDLRTNTVRLNNGGIINNYLPDLDLAGTYRPMVASLHLSSKFNMYNDWKAIATLDKQNSPSVTLNKDLYLFHDGTNYYDGNIGCLLVGHALTLSEYYLLYAGLLQFGRALGRIPASAPNDYFFGDSITWQTAASLPTKKYSYLRSVADSRREVNSGIVASSMIADGAYTQPSGFQRRGEIVKYVQDNLGTVVRIMYGVNDITLISSTAYATFQIMLEWIIKEVVAVGGTVHVSTIPFINTGSPTLITNYRALVLLTAKKLGILFVDMYDYMSNHGGVSLLNADNIHPEDAGHAVLSDGWSTVAIPDPDGIKRHLCYFNAATGSDVSLVVPDTGSTWSSTNSGTWQITNDTTPNHLPYYATTVGAAPGGNDWQIESNLGRTDYTIYFYAQKTGPNDIARFIVRKTDSNNYVEVRWGTSNAMTFNNVVSGVSTGFGTISVTPTQSNPHLFKIVVNGTSISVTVDFGTTYSGTIPSVQSGTKIGLGQLTSTAGVVKLYQVYAHD